MKRPKAPVDSVPPLSASVERGFDPLNACNLCGVPGELAALRECDAADRPLPGPAALVFVGVGHKACAKVVKDHPRLYLDTRGEPGSFPKLCGPCTHRRGLACSHPNLKTNGGAGLKVGLGGIFPGVIICGRGGRIRPVGVALDCEGQELPGERALAAAEAMLDPDVPEKPIAMETS